MLSVISLDDHEKWNHFVKSFKNHDVFHLPNYTKSFKIHGDGEPLLFYFENHEIKAINVVMLRDISSDSRFSGHLPQKTFFDLSTPYGYGGFLLEGDITDDSLKVLNEKYSTYCKNAGIISEFVRFHPVLDNSQYANAIYDVTKLGKTISVSLATQEKIWSNLANRKKINKAKKLGIQVLWGRTPELFNQFRSMYIETMKNNAATDYYYFKEEFFDTILNDLKQNSMIFYATYEGRIVAMVLVIFANHGMHTFLSALDQEFKNLPATNLLFYEVASWGCENGFKTLHLGGGLGNKEDSIYKFKEGFNKHSNTFFSIGKKIFDEEKYNELVDFRRKEKGFDVSGLFFPLYRS